MNLCSTGVYKHLCASLDSKHSSHLPNDPPSLGESRDEDDLDDTTPSRMQDSTCFVFPATNLAVDYLCGFGTSVR